VDGVVCFLDDALDLGQAVALEENAEQNLPLIFIAVLQRVRQAPEVQRIRQTASSSRYKRPPFHFIELQIRKIRKTNLFTFEFEENENLRISSLFRKEGRNLERS
jgi:hypothetical protein